MRKICSFLTLCFIVAAALCCLYGFPPAIRQVEADTRQYLLDDGYGAEDIQSLQGYFDRMEDVPYYVKVVLADSPDEELVYSYDNGGNIVLTGKNSGQMPEKGL